MRFSGRDMAHIARCPQIQFWFNAGLCRVFQSLSSSSLAQQTQGEGFTQQPQLHINNSIPNLIDSAKEKLLVERRNKVSAPRARSAAGSNLAQGAGVSRWGCQTAHTDTHGHSYFSFDPHTSQQAGQRCQGRYPALFPWCSQASSIPARASSPPAPLPERDAPGGRVGQSPHPRHPPPHLSRGVGAVGPYRAGSLSAAPPCRRSPRAAPAPAPLRSPRPTRDPAAPRPQPPPTPAPPAAAPPLRAVIFIYIRRRRLRGFLK